jgi:tetratricopeptide (TPR) repeat protein
MNWLCQLRFGTFILMGVLAIQAAAQKPSAKHRDPPPDNAAALPIRVAHLQIQAALASQYAGIFSYDTAHPTTYKVGISSFTFKSDGIEYKSAFTGRRESLVFAKSDYLEVQDPINSSIPGGTVYSVSRIPAYFQHLSDTQAFLEGVNRLIYAAHRGESSSLPGEDFLGFKSAATAWRHSSTANSDLPPELEKERILAENALKERDAYAAIVHYEKGLEANPMWPQGWFNAALIYAEMKDYGDAADHIRHYLELAPDAPDAKNAREQLTIWEDKASRGFLQTGAAERKSPGGF